MTTEPENSTMGKSQKTFYLNDDLSNLIDEFAKRYGTSFTRVMTASVLKFLFDELRRPEVGKPDSPDGYWVHVATLLERGDLKPEDVPIAVLESVAEDAQRTARLFGQGDPDEQERRRERKDGLVTLAKLANEKISSWKLDREEFGNLGAIEEMVKKAFASPLH